MKSVLNGLNSVLEVADETVSKLKGRSVGIIQLTG